MTPMVGTKRQVSRVTRLCAGCGASIESGHLCTAGCQHDGAIALRPMVVQRWVGELELVEVREENGRSCGL